MVFPLAIITHLFDHIDGDDMDDRVVAVCLDMMVCVRIGLRVLATLLRLSRQFCSERTWTLQKLTHLSPIIAHLFDHIDGDDMDDRVVAVCLDMMVCVRIGLRVLATLLRLSRQFCSERTWTLQKLTHL